MAAGASEALDECWPMEMIQAGNPIVAHDILTDDSVIHVNQGPAICGLEGASQPGGLHAAIRDLRVSRQEIIASEERLMLHWIVDGLHGGDYFGVPASGKQIHNQGNESDSSAGWENREMWIVFDNLSLLQQMGAIPRYKPP